MAANPSSISFRRDTHNTYGWQKEINRRVREAGAALRFEPGAETAYTDGKTIVVPFPPEDATQEDFDVMRGLVLHEVGHLKRPKCFDYIRDYNLKEHPTLFTILNQIEDRAQERAICSPWPGDRKAIDRLHSLLNDRQAEKAAAKKDWPTDPKAKERAVKLIASMAVGIDSASDWLPLTTRGLDHCVATIDRAVGGGVQDMRDALIAEGWADRIREVTTVESAWELSLELHKRLFPDEEQPKKGEASGKGKGKPKSGKPGDEEAEVEPTEGVIPWELVLRSDHSDEMPGAQCPSSIDWSGKNVDGTVVWYTNEQVIKPPVSGPKVTATHAYADLVQETRRLLQAKSRNVWRREKLEGRLDRRNLQRLVMPQVGDGTYNRSVFQKKEEGLKLDTAVTILVDSSGSMSGAKFAAATDAALALYDMSVLGLRVPTEVLGFTHRGGSSGGHPEFYIYKDFAEKRIDRGLIKARMDYAAQRLNGNSDGDAIMWAYNRILHQRTTRKVIVVLSDGSPSEALMHDPDAALNKAIRTIRKAKQAEVYGIGIMDQNVRRYYSKNAPVIDRADRVGPALIETLKDVLQKESGG